MNLVPTRTRTRSLTNPNAAAFAHCVADDVIAQMQIEQLNIDALHTPPRALRKTNRRHQKALESSLRAFGIVKPIIIDAVGSIVVGSAVWRAAKAIGLQTVPTVRISHLTPEMIRLFRIAANQIASLGSWDDEMLKIELEELSGLCLDLNLELTGFSSAEIDDFLLRKTPKNGHLSVDRDEDSPINARAVTKPGDLWIAGDHRIFCGDALKEASYIALMAGDLAQMVVADPPYNVKIGGNVSSRKGTREFASASGEMTPLEFIQFLAAGFRLCAKYSIDGSIHYHCIDWRHVWEMLSAGREEYTEHKNILIWNKTNASMGWYRSQYEMICVFKHGTAPHIDNFGLGETGRYRTNVITLPGSNTFRKGRDEDLAAHPTVKNFTLIADLIRDCSKRGGIILDNFGGSGTSVLAAEWTGRQARLIEIDPGYVDVSLLRWMKQTGRGVSLAGTSQTFDEVAAERGIDLGDSSIAGDGEINVAFGESDNDKA